MCGVRAETGDKIHAYLVFADCCLHNYICNIGVVNTIAQTNNTPPCLHTPPCTPTLWAAGTAPLLSPAPLGAVPAHDSCSDLSGSRQTAQQSDQTAPQDQPVHSPDRWHKSHACRRHEQRTVDTAIHNRRHQQRRNYILQCRGFVVGSSPPPPTLGWVHVVGGSNVLN